MKKLVKQIMREITKAGYFVTMDIHGGVLSIKESMYHSDSVTMYITGSLIYENRFKITMPYYYERTNNGIYDALYAYYNGRVIQK